MLTAALALGFTSCNKTASESDTHTQTFSLGETSYDINNAFTVENIHYDGSEIYNAIVVTQGELIGSDADTKGVVIVFRGDITTGTYTFTGEELDFPKYLYTDIEITDITSFNIEEMQASDDTYLAISGTLVLDVDDNFFTITTDGVEVEKADDPAILETSSVDYEGNVTRFVLAEVEPGSELNDGTEDYDIVTAGCTSFSIFGFQQKIVCFIAENGDAIGFTYEGESVPTGTLSGSTVIFVEGLNINNMAFPTGATINVALNGDIYTVTIEGAHVSDKTYNLNYAGTLPFFTLPL